MDVAALIGTLDDFGFEDLSTDTKVREIQGAIWDIEKLRPWPFLEVSVLLNFTGTDVPSNMPADFRATIRLRDLVASCRIYPKRLDDADDAIGADLTETGDPEFYYFEGGQLKVWPIPPASTARMKLRYLQWSDEITSGSAESAILIPKYFHESTIVNRALQRLCDMTDDPELAARYDGQYKEGLMEMVEACFTRQYDQQDYVLVVDPDDWDDLG